MSSSFWRQKIYRMQVTNHSNFDQHPFSNSKDWQQWKFSKKTRKRKKVLRKQLEGPKSNLRKLSQRKRQMTETQSSHINPWCHNVYKSHITQRNRHPRKIIWLQTKMVLEWNSSSRYLFDILYHREPFLTWASSWMCSCTSY